MRNYVTAVLLGCALLIGGCDSPTGENGIVVTADPRPDFVVQYIPTAQNRRAMPYPNDIWFSGSTDGTLNIPGSLSSTGAAGANKASVNLLDGYSTTSVVTVPFNFPVDITTVVPYLPTPPAGVPALPGTNLWVLDVTDPTAPAPLIPLVPGVTDAIAEYTFRVSTATDAQGAVLEIVPVKPFKPERRIAFLITAGVADVLGNPLSPDNQFRDIRDACFNGTVIGNILLDGITSANCPLLQAIAAQTQLPPEAFMVAWTMQTMSIGLSLEAINESATSQASLLVPSGLTTSSATGGQLPGYADIYVGTLDVPYYLDPLNPYASTWQGAGGSVLTKFNPVAVPRTTLTIPMIATVPNGTDPGGQAKPAEGWPVVVYLHGITSDRSTTIALADSFAAAGYVVIGIDQPLHGVKDPTSPLFQGADSPFGANERHFGLDNFTAFQPDGSVSVVPGPDGLIDDGAQILTASLSAPLNFRDFGRQAASDLIHLVRTLPNIDLDNDPATQDIDATRVHFVGVSLGSLMSASFLGTNTEVATATLSSEGGTFSSFNAQNSSFGRIVFTLVQQGTGLAPGTMGFDEFLRDWQHAVDAIDPLNYAGRMVSKLPLHVIEILNDNTVPNVSTENFASVAGLAGISGPTADPNGIRGIVRFTDGGHASFLRPTDVIRDLDTGEIIQGPNPLVTFEMQQQSVSFALSFGTQLAVNQPLAGAGGATCDCVQ